MMKSREEILAKAEELVQFEEESAQREASFILFDIAGESEADMCSDDGIHDYLHSYKRWSEKPVLQAAHTIASDFLNN